MRKNISNSKLYYSISEVAEITSLEQHVLRYWETEFAKLKPKKNRAGNRQYRDKDIQIIKYIKTLLHNDMYTVQGARKKLSDSSYKEIEGQLNLLSSIPQSSVMPSNSNQVSQPAVDKNIIKNIVTELQLILKLLHK